jgi:hypothetical protein
MTASEVYVIDAHGLSQTYEGISALQPLNFRSPPAFYLWIPRSKWRR